MSRQLANWDRDGILVVVTRLVARVENNDPKKCPTTDVCHNTTSTVAAAAREVLLNVIAAGKTVGLMAQLYTIHKATARHRTYMAS